MSEQFNTDYAAFDGAVYLGDPSGTGKPENLKFIGDMSTAEITPNVTRQNVIERVTGQSAVGASWQEGLEYALSMNMRSVKPEHLQFPLQADLTVKNGTSVSGEPIRCFHDTMVMLGQTMVSSVAISGFTEGTDFIVHPEAGLIEILSTGSIVDGALESVDYTYAAQSHLDVNPSEVEKCMVFAGLNKTNKKRVRCEIYSIKLDPSALSLMTSGRTDIPLTGIIQRNTNRAADDQLFSWIMEN